MSQLGNLLILLVASVYMGMLIILLYKRGIHENIVQYLSVYITISFGLDIFRSLYLFNLFDANTQQIFYLISNVCIAGLSILYLKICDLILPIRSDNRSWFAAGFLWTIGLFALLSLSFPEFSTPIFGEISLLSMNMVINLLAVLGWAAIMSRIVYLSFKSYRIVNRPLHKNRLIYWTISLLIVVLGDVFLFRNIIVIGSGMHFAGVGVIVYMLLTHNLVDIFRTSLQTLRYLITTFLAMLVYAILLILMQPIIQEIPGYNPLLGALMMAGILALLINPVMNRISKHVNTLLLGMDYDPNTVMREYSQSISNIVDLNLLEKISMNLIKNTFGLDVGHLYVVEEKLSKVSVNYQLRDVGEDEEEGYLYVELQSHNPITKRFLEDRKPLTQYDLDYDPVFYSRTGNRKIFNQAIDVYVPIYQNDHWIGLFALGPKTSGDRFYDEEIMLLETLADQSAVALENAKLFSRLSQMNKELTQAQKELEEVNTRLLEIDQLKSAFISVITHEMRTPLSNLGFALNIFDMYGRENLTAEQQTQIEELYKSLTGAQRMVDNLVTYASFLNDQLELKKDRVDIRDTIVRAIEPNQSAAQDKGIEIKLDFSGKNFTLNGDSKLIFEAVYHLVNNAVKFTQDGGSIIISCWTTSEGFVVNVKDNGSGIPPARLQNIWDAFVSISNPLQRGWEGLGLGLALVKLVVEAHGGHVWAQSIVGKGSDFGFQLPLAV